jgi:hypothetical protein
LPRNENVQLYEYLQSYKYFINYADEIREEFRFQSNIDEICSRNMTRFMKDKCTLIGVHVRRGDFVNNNVQQPAEKDYLDRAMRYFRTINTTCVRFLVLGDDYNWNVANIAAAKVLS